MLQSGNSVILADCWQSVKVNVKPQLITVSTIISPAAGLCAKSIISPGRTDTEIYFQSGRTDTSGLIIDFAHSPAAGLIIALLLSVWRPLFSVWLRWCHLSNMIEVTGFKDEP